MKYWKKSILLVILFLFGFIILNGLTSSLTYLFIFPLLAIVIYLAYYLHKQNHIDDEARIQKGMKYAIEDTAAEKWVEKSLAPQTFSFIKTKRWIIILYSFVFIAGLIFLWSYVSNGLWIAVKDVTYAALLFWIFIFYIIFTSWFAKILWNIFPKKLRERKTNEWQHGYLLLLPISFLLYLVYPFESITTQFLSKLLSFPAFFLIYTSFFLCLYAVVYMYQDITAENKKILQGKIKKLIEEESPEGN
jgi:hypothetical protein